MVTGVETAGLVLAILPLLISALEHYQNGLWPIKVFTRTPLELNKFIRSLGEQSTFLRMNMIELFQAIPSMSDAYVAVLKDPDADLRSILWEDKELQDEVRRVLGPAYLSYMDNVDKMSVALGKLMGHKSLKIFSTGVRISTHTRLQELICL
jgi:hypothetical protein